ncbi:hypothetical protein LIER_24985 [Lithospermum erythrorhizon]|uniref:Uncharacterized protein n=1 Tax=Lithospermum erythrorhizon TaxID=34254 RepID=A0AAV3R5A3_LITER
MAYSSPFMPLCLYGGDFVYVEGFPEDVLTPSQFTKGLRRPWMALPGTRRTLLHSRTSRLIRVPYPMGSTSSHPSWRVPCPMGSYPLSSFPCYIFRPKDFEVCSLPLIPFDHHGYIHYDHSCKPRASNNAGLVVVSNSSEEDEVIGLSTEGEHSPTLVLEPNNKGEVASKTPLVTDPSPPLAPVPQTTQASIPPTLAPEKPSASKKREGSPLLNARPACSQRRSNKAPRCRGEGILFYSPPCNTANASIVLARHNDRRINVLLNKAKMDVINNNLSLRKKLTEVTTEHDVLKDELRVGLL